MHPDGLQTGNNVFVNKTLITYDISQPCNKTGTATFTAEVLDGQGRPLGNASVTFLIAGKVLTKLTDEKGIAFINIKSISWSLYYYNNLQRLFCRKNFRDLQ